MIHRKYTHKQTAFWHVHRWPMHDVALLLMIAMIFASGISLRGQLTDQIPDQETQESEVIVSTLETAEIEEIITLEDTDEDDILKEEIDSAEEEFLTPEDFDILDETSAETSTETDADILEPVEDLEIGDVLEIDEMEQGLSTDDEFELTADDAADLENAEADEPLKTLEGDTSTDELVESSEFIEEDLQVEEVDEEALDELETDKVVEELNEENEEEALEDFVEQETEELNENVAGKQPSVERNTLVATEPLTLQEGSLLKRPEVQEMQQGVEAGAVSLTLARVNLDKADGETLTTEEALTAMLEVSTRTDDIREAMVESMFTDSAMASNVVNRVLNNRTLANKLDAVNEDSINIRNVLPGEIATNNQLRKEVVAAIEEDATFKDELHIIPTASLETLVNANNTIEKVSAVLESALVETGELQVGGIETQTQPLLQVMLTMPNGEEVIVPNNKLSFTAGSVVMNIEPLRSFTPGLYDAVITIYNPLTGNTETLTQSFAWGVLALNSDKDQYNLAETADLHIGVLDDEGEIVCNAEVELSITSPSGNNTILDTYNDSIAVSDTCAVKEAGFIHYYRWSNATIYGYP